MPNFKAITPTQHDYDTDHEEILRQINALKRSGTGNTSPSLAIVNPSAATPQASSSSRVIPVPSVTTTPSLPTATTSTPGIVELSTAATDAATPIAVSDTDPRNTDARTPTGPAGGDLTGTYPNPTIAVPVPNFADNETPSGTINGINQAFTVAHAPSPTTSVHLYMSGLRITPTGNFSVSGTTITFTVAPAIGAVLLVDYRY